MLLQLKIILLGKDAETWMKEKSSMSDEEFYKMMKQLMK